MQNQETQIQLEKEQENNINIQIQTLKMKDENLKLNKVGCEDQNFIKHQYEPFLKDFLRESPQNQYLNPSQKYIQYTVKFKKSLLIYTTKQASIEYNIVQDLDFLDYILIKDIQQFGPEEDKSKILQLQFSGYWIILKETEFVEIYSIYPDNTTFTTSYYKNSNYFPTLAFFNKQENTKDTLYLTFALFNQQEFKKNESKLKQNSQTLETLKPKSLLQFSQNQSEKLQLEETQKVFLEQIEQSEQVYLTVFNPPSFSTPLSKGKLKESQFMQSLIKSKIKQIKILMHENLRAYQGIFSLLTYLAEEKIKTKQETVFKNDIQANDDNNKRIKQSYNARQTIVILKDQCYQEDLENIEQYHNHFITWIQEQRNFYYNAQSIVKDYYQCVEFKPSSIFNNTNIKHFMNNGKIDYKQIFYYYEVKRGYKTFNLMFASSGSYAYYDQKLQENEYDEQYSNVLQEQLYEISYYTVNSRLKIQQQLFQTDTEIYAKELIQEKEMADVYQEKQDFHSFMGYIVNNFFVFVKIENERKYVEKMQKSATFFIKQYFFICMSFLIVVPFQTFFPTIKYILNKNKPYYMRQFVNNWFQFRTVKRDNLKKFLLLTTFYASILHFILLSSNIFAIVASFQTLKHFMDLKYDIFILLLTYVEIIYVGGLIVLNIFIVLVVFQIQEENIQLQNQNKMNELGIAQENFYIELMQDFSDQHLKHNIPEIPQQDATKQLYNIQTSNYVDQTQKLGKKWISITQLMIFFAQRGNILTRDVFYKDMYYQYIKKGLSYSKVTGLVLFIVILIICRMAGIISLRQNFGFDNDILLIGYFYITFVTYLFFAYQVLIVKFFVQRNKRRAIQRVLNMIKPRYMEVDVPDVYKNIANEIPIINVACINSWSQWIHYYSLVQETIRIDEPYFDVNDTLNLLFFLGYVIMIFLDFFGFLWKKQYLIDNQGFMIIIVLDLFIILLLILMNLYYKVKRNASFVIFEKTVKLHLQQFKAFYANIDILYEEFKFIQIQKKIIEEKKQQKQEKDSLQIINELKQLKKDKSEEHIKNNLGNYVLEVLDQSQQKNEQNERKNSTLLFQTKIKEIQEQKIWEQKQINENMKFTSHSLKIQQQYMIKIVREVCIDKNLKSVDENQQITVDQVQLQDIKYHILKLKEKLEYISEKLLIDKEKNQAKFLGLIVLDQKLLSSVIASAIIAIGSLIAQIVGQELQKQN